MNKRETSVRDWEIERHLLSELPTAQSEAVARALATDGAVLARANEIEASDREILAVHPPHVAAAIIRERLAGERPTARRWLRPVLALASAVVVVGAGSLLLRDPEPPLSENRIKGLRPSLLVYRHTPAGNEVLADRAPARAGDLIQVTYQAAGRRFGAIVSLDGRGGVTVHHPHGTSRAARLVSGQPVRLTSAYRLDDAPRWEQEW